MILFSGFECDALYEKALLSLASKLLIENTHTHSLVSASTGNSSSKLR